MMNRDFNLNIEQIQTISQMQKMKMGMKFSNLLELNPKDYFELYREIENSPVFQRLSVPGEQKAIRIVPVCYYHGALRFRQNAVNAETDPDTGFGQSFEAIPAPDTDMESLIEEMLIEKNNPLFEKIRGIGPGLFIYYFVEGNGTDCEISDLLGITPAETRELRRFFDSLLINDILGSDYPTVEINPDIIHGEIIAEIRFIEGRPQFLFAYERQRYIIDRDKIEEMLKNNQIANEELKELKEIQEKMNVINYRLNLLNEIVYLAVNTQKKFLQSGRIEDLSVFEEQHSAEILGVDVSWISRLIGGKKGGKWIKVSKRYVQLRDLFVTSKELNKRLGKRYLSRIIRNNRENTGKNKKLTDENIRKTLENSYGMKVSRRTVNNWRREIG